MKRFLLAVFCVVLAGCNSQNVDEIKGNTFVLIDSPEGLEITITFDAEAPRFHGKAVNGYFASYQIDGNRLKIMPIASTMMAAPEPLMNAETAYFNALQNMTKISIDKDILTLSNDKEKLVFMKQPAQNDTQDDEGEIERLDEPEL